MILMDKQTNKNTMKKVVALAVTTSMVAAPALGITTPISWDTSITASAAVSISSATWSGN